MERAVTQGNRAGPWSNCIWTSSGQCIIIPENPLLSLLRIMFTYSIDITFGHVTYFVSWKKCMWFREAVKANIQGLSGKKNAAINASIVLVHGWTALRWLQRFPVCSSMTCARLSTVPSVCTQKVDTSRREGVCFKETFVVNYCSFGILIQHSLVNSNYFSLWSLPLKEPTHVLYRWSQCELSVIVYWKYRNW